MSVVFSNQPKSNKKCVLQQSNLNLEVAKSKEEKLQGKSLFVEKNNKEMQETENHSPLPRLVKPFKSDAKKLRSIRLDLSSLKRGFAHKSKIDFSSEDSSEDEATKKRKSRPVVPNYVTNSDSGPCRKPRQNRQDSFTLSSQNSPALAKSQPLSIARRNARERNRVKQVNEGFATLRSRIPEYISEAYNEEKGRKSAKKLSKVETLRMAVDYIRHLETLLDIKSTDHEWSEETNTESQPWDTPSSSVDYPSPIESKYRVSCVESPVTSYDHGFEYQDRIFYDYDLDFVPRKNVSDSGKRSGGLGGVAFMRNERETVDEFRYYETFNRLKKEGGESVNEDNVVEDEDLASSDRESDQSSMATGNLKTGRTVLPSITETFSKGIPVFY